MQQPLTITFDTNHPIYQSFAKFADIFYQYPALRRGEQATVFQADDNNIFAITRTISNEQTMLVAFNVGDSTATANISVNGNEYKQVAGSSKLVKNANSGAW